MVLLVRYKFVFSFMSFLQEIFIFTHKRIENNTRDLKTSFSLIQIVGGHRRPFSRNGKGKELGLIALILISGLNSKKIKGCPNSMILACKNYFFSIRSLELGFRMLANR